MEPVDITLTCIEEKLRILWCMISKSNNIWRHFLWVALMYEFSFGRESHIFRWVAFIDSISQSFPICLHISWRAVNFMVSVLFDVR